MLFALLAMVILAVPCDETVTIDSVEYAVPERWCGKALDSTLVVDKTSLYRLPDSFCYEDYRIYLQKSTRDAFVEMGRAAAKDSIRLLVDSGYRSAEYQARIIRRRMEKGDSFERVARFVAPPGYSEHETGRAVDLVPSEIAFAETDTYCWLKENAHLWDFIESIPKDSTSGQHWEPWHWYYLGKAEGDR